MMLPKSKKGNLMGLTDQVIGFGVFVMVLAVVGLILVGFQSGQTADSLAYNITKDGMTGTSKISAQSSTIAIIIVAVLLIGLIVGGFAGLGRKQ